MNEHQPKSNRGQIWIIGSAVVVTLLFFGSAVLYNRLSTRATIVIGTNGTAHVGVIPLKNKTVRDLTLKGLAHLQSSTVSVAIARSARVSEVVTMLNEMNRAGITSVVLRTETNAK
jgi:hypothetical protein